MLFSMIRLLPRVHLWHTINKNNILVSKIFLGQAGDPTATGTGGESEDEDPLATLPEEEEERIRRAKAAAASALTLEMVGDLPFDDQKTSYLVVNLSLLLGMKI
jgi:hypothetical protein